MDIDIKSTKKNETSDLLHLTFLVVASCAIYIVANTYVSQVTRQEDEEISFAATALCIGGVYLGRFIALLFVHSRSIVQNALLVGLTIVMVGCLFMCATFAGSLLTHQQFMYVLFLSLPLFLLSIAAGMFIKILRSKIKKELLQANVYAAHSESELQLLQSQLSPHFLFNTLNNLYGISITQHEKLPPLLLKLSDLLRYSVYDAKEVFVPLKDELAYINNYIDFEKIRIGDRLILKMEMEQLTNADFKIAPMLLIIFVENAFKHSKNTSDQQIFVDIAFKIWGGSLFFSVKNSHSRKAKENALAVDSSGFGLASVQKRLELLYPNEYNLEIEDKDDTYSVMLRLKIR